ncbi:MAG: right-handed parallel beta-helix repeat-containing protein [Myxococcales bacterium]|nr:right-handed parallel beta-helix repeat-containing protein [Myxococcales bacterium]
MTRYRILSILLAGCSSSTADGHLGPDHRPIPRSSGDVEEGSSAGRATAGCVPGTGSDYTVGPGQKYRSLAEVPWAQLGPGDTVRIHHRPEPYHEKIMVGGVGRADAPIKVCGVRGPSGELPVLDGDGAKTQEGLEFPYDGHQVRGLVIIGKRHSDPYREQPEHIVIEGLEIRNANRTKRFFDRHGKETKWAENAAGIFLQRGDHVTIRGCVVHDNENGLFLGTAGAEELSHDVLLEGNHVYGNASPTDWYEHNVYNEASGVVIQYNHFGPPKRGPNGTLGANIKERSAGVVIRYNWIEDGAHLIDLVDSQEARDPNLKNPAFHESFVYGNVLVRGKEASGSMVHYGGDSGLYDTYRKGTLHFHHNTVIVQNGSHGEWQGTAVFELSTNDEKLDMRNNVVFAESAPTPNRPVALLGARDGVISGDATLLGNWLSTGVNAFDGIPGKMHDRRGKVAGFDASLFGADPGFADLAKLDLSPGPSSALRGKAGRLEGKHAVLMQYVRHGRAEARPAETPASIGAFAARSP